MSGQLAQDWPELVGVVPDLINAAPNLDRFRQKFGRLRATLALMLVDVVPKLGKFGPSSAKLRPVRPCQTISTRIRPKLSDSAWTWPDLGMRRPALHLFPERHVIERPRQAASAQRGRARAKQWTEPLPPSAPDRPIPTGRQNQCAHDAISTHTHTAICTSVPCASS